MTSATSSRYAKSIDTPLYRLLKSHLLPGPYTFILPASKEVLWIPKSKKGHDRTLGYPPTEIAREIVRTLGHPILSTSLPGDMVEEYTDPDLIFANFGSQVDIVVDGGPGGMVASTVIDCTTDQLRLAPARGLGPWPEPPGLTPGVGTPGRLAWTGFIILGQTLL